MVMKYTEEGLPKILFELRGLCTYDDVMFLYVMTRLYDVLGEILAAFVKTLEGV